MRSWPGTRKKGFDNLHLAQDAQDALVELTASDVSYGYYNMTLLALGRDQKEAENSADLMSGNLRANGFSLLRERQGLMSAFFTSMPGNANAVLRWKLASTANLADLAPIRTITRGEKTHPLFSRLLGHEVPPLCRFLTPYGITYDFNPHETDLGHTAIIGGAGSGKTSLMTLFIAQFQKYTPAQTFIFDKDHSLMMATVLLGGKHIDLGGKSGKSIGMNPVRVMLSGETAAAVELTRALPGMKTSSGYPTAALEVVCLEPWVGIAEFNIPSQVIEDALCVFRRS